MYRPLLAALAAPVLLAQAPSVDQLIARHLEARGGLKSLRAVQTLRTSGRLMLGPMACPTTSEYRRGAFRTDTTVQGKTRTTVFNGGLGWNLDPWTGPGRLVPMLPADLAQAVLQADFDGPLVDWAAKGHRVAYLGQDKVQGAPAHKLQIRLATGETLVSYLDAQTFLEVRQTCLRQAGGKASEVDTWMADYRTVRGVKLPFAFEIQAKGQPGSLTIQLDQVDVNVPLDEARLAPPAR